MMLTVVSCLCLFMAGSAAVTGLSVGGGGDVQQWELVIAPLIDGKTLPIDRHLSWPSGRSLNLTCRVTSKGQKDGGGNDDFVMAWTLPSGHVLNKPFVEIESTRKSDSGDYRCSATLKNTHSSSNQNSADSKESRLKMTAKLFLDVWSISEREEKSCGPGFYQCPSDGYCIGRRFMCDGRRDCRTDGADESEEECGYGDPCQSKLPCHDGRCMDPTLCCDPLIHPNCTGVVPDCCKALLESNRHYFQYGREREQEIRFLHSTIYTIIGCVLAFIGVLTGAVCVICKFHLKRGLFLTGGAGGGDDDDDDSSSRRRRRGAAGTLGNNGWSIRFSRHRAPQAELTRADLDLYFAYLQRVDSLAAAAGGDGRGVAGRFNAITYNVNNGVQVLATGAVAPPPYSAQAAGEASERRGRQEAAAAAAAAEAPPPYVENEIRFNATNQARVVTNAAPPPAAAAEVGGAVGGVVRRSTEDGGDDDDEQAQPLMEENNNNNEDNNNGDINGNSDMVDHNEVRRRELLEQQEEQQQREQEEHQR